MEVVAPAWQAALAGPIIVYGLGLLWFLRGARLAEDVSEPSAREFPSVTIVVAARNEVEHVQGCLQGLAMQTYPKDCFEIVLVDDGSTDGTGELAHTTASQLSETGTRIQIVDGPSIYGQGGSKKAALTLGIEKSAGEIVLTTDADCQVPPRWVESMVARFSSQTGAVVGFSQIAATHGPGAQLARWEGLDFLQLMTAAAGSCAQGHPMAASGQSLGFRRQAFHDVGGYGQVKHRVSGDDVLLLQLIRGTGRWVIDFCGDTGARVIHPPSPGLRSFLSRRARWASNAPLQMRMDPFFFCYMLATFLASASLLSSVALWALGGVSLSLVGALWAGKVTAEAALACTGARRFARMDLLWAFPSWTVLQPLYTVLVGLVGPAGFFRWKGRRVALGRQSA